MKRIVALSLLFVPLAGCSWLGSDTTPDEPEVIETERPETKNVIYRGRLLPLGSSIYMEGTHRLELEDGRFVLLESDGLVLDEYLNEDVEVFGSTRATIEGSAIIMRVERVANLVASSEASSEPAVASSSEASSSVPAAASSVAPVASSRAPVMVLSSSSRAPVSSAAPVVSSAPAASSVASSDAAFQARVTAMAKVNMAATNWTQQYCAPTHLAFCFPIHKNWYFNSFGATSNSQWHVELSSEELETLGDGPIGIVLVSGTAPAPDGHVTVDGGTVTGIRAWTNNRHFVISAPAQLEAAVRYITQELKAAPAASSAAAQ